MQEAEKAEKKAPVKMLEPRVEKAIDAMVGRAIRDHEYRELLLTQPEKAMEGYDLSEEEIQAVKIIDTNASREFFKTVDDIPSRCWCTDKKCSSGFWHRELPSWEEMGKIAAGDSTVIGNYRKRVEKDIVKQRH
jgi:hypothetical protein